MVCIMSKCRNCHVTIKDHTQVCPLCHCVLEQQGDSRNTYPDIRFQTKFLLLVGRIYLFLILLAGVTLGALNYKFYHGCWWFLIVVACMSYLYLVFRFAILDDAGYKSKIIVLVISAMLLVVLIDYVTGYEGWSVNYVIPGGILFFDVGIVLLMIINYRNWQSYLLFQLFVIGCSLVPLLLWWLDIVTEPLLSLITVGISVFLFLGTVIIGDRRARTELKRRFHVR